MCIRDSNKPPISPTVLLQHMYQGNSQQLQLPYAVDADQGLEINDRESQEKFEDFYEDIFYELTKFGELDELNVVDNVGPHLIGNVYVKFKREEDAEKACSNLTGRFYAGRPLIVEYSPVTDFREACCRQYDFNECTRGGDCNFMHLKKIGSSLHKDLFGYYPRDRWERESSRDRGGDERDRRHSKDRHSRHEDRYSRGSRERSHSHRRSHSRHRRSSSHDRKRKRSKERRHRRHRSHRHRERDEYDDVSGHSGHENSGRSGRSSDEQPRNERAHNEKSNEPESGHLEEALPMEKRRKLEDGTTAPPEQYPPADVSQAPLATTNPIDSSSVQDTKSDLNANPLSSSAEAPQADVPAKQEPQIDAPIKQEPKADAQEPEGTSNSDQVEQNST
eukprot:TRINITY_DN7959_c0_g1_i4.p1 TRINITY_DN7959_c0_g1~~TRINITY_DN7959_c0_g1_i4.p1  ORF type:complete len:391 (+),score=52.88 TRINITY_DN7959_c0_g1_i4:45-1217(+)